MTSLFLSRYLHEGSLWRKCALNLFFYYFEASAFPVSQQVVSIHDVPSDVQIYLRARSD